MATDRWTDTAVRQDEMFTVSEVEAILRRALNRKRDTGEITREELEDTARELGIDVNEVARAIHEQRKLGAVESAREEFKARQKHDFYQHLRSYLIVCGALFLLDVLITGGSWFYYVMIAWESVWRFMHRTHLTRASARLNGVRGASSKSSSGATAITINARRMVKR